ncbi:MAG: NINE protein [Oscillatoriales cyanobacterium C42_A2020_001]|nr:NINE protein [Leptolyngbyaceae cyanobacterium C42_A2020_001]
MNNIGTAYVLWLGCLLQLHGLQRLYNGKIFTGFLWLFTFGLMGFGQLIDLMLIPGMVDEHNAKYRAKHGMLPPNSPHLQPVIQRVVAHEFAPPPAVIPTRDRLVVQLVRAAHSRNGKLSVTQGVMDTEANFVEVEAALRGLVKTGYVDIYNDPETGVVMYDFREL